MKTNWLLTQNDSESESTEFKVIDCPEVLMILDKTDKS